MLLKMPGINTKNVYSILNNVESIAELTTLSEDGLKTLLGSELHAKLLYDFLHKHYQTVANFDADKSKSIATRRKPKFYKKKGAT